MAEGFRNWSGSIDFTPTRHVEPTDEDEVREIVRQTAESGRTLRPVGRGHSSMPLMETEHTLMSLRNMRGVVSYSRERMEAEVLPGTFIRELGQELHREGLATENMGDVDFQAVAGAVGTGTHGTGRRFGNLSTLVTGVRMVTADGGVVDWHQDTHPELMRSARVSLGALGVFTLIRLRLEPAHDLHRLSWCVDTEVVLDHMDELVERNRMFDFYWYPRRDETQVRTLNRPGHEPDLDLPTRGLYEQDLGPIHQVLPKDQELRYEEIEYLMPLEAGPSCFRQVRDRIMRHHRDRVGWRVLYRTIAGDDNHLSPSHGRDSVSIALLHNASLPYQDYFFDIERIFLAHGGRPHWGKKHSLSADRLRPLYPEWDRFARDRRDLDPQGVFLNDHLRESLVVPSGGEGTS